LLGSLWSSSCVKKPVPLVAVPSVLAVTKAVASPAGGDNRGRPTNLLVAAALAARKETAERSDSFIMKKTSDLRWTERMRDIVMGQNVPLSNISVGSPARQVVPGATQPYSAKASAHLATSPFLMDWATVRQGQSLCHWPAASRSRNSASPALAVSPEPQLGVSLPAWLPADQEGREIAPD
jgi:hypothetical protein